MAIDGTPKVRSDIAVDGGVRESDVAQVVDMTKEVGAPTSSTFFEVAASESDERRSQFIAAQKVLAEMIARPRDFLYVERNGERWEGDEAIAKMRALMRSYLSE